MSPRWFGQDEVSPGIVIELENRWRVLSHEEEVVMQAGERNTATQCRPYACILLKVRQVGSRPPVYGNMRIYKQIPTEETVGDRPEVRAKRARVWVPLELKAYRQLMLKDSTFTPRLLDSLEEKQDADSLVPGGFMVWVVSEEVSGIRLGDEESDDIFWSMERNVRQQIRDSFKENYLKMVSWEWIPFYCHCEDLIWVPGTSTLFFVNWFMPDEVVAPDDWEDRFFYASGLLRPPASSTFPIQIWNNSVEGWQG
ncbi:hypothetical protein M752DRAFT_269521 [Aspergillus phoenicis ATCC 13157]|uniref:Uncharacterized protein n=1 Tax=Aspergillus phoenicis ATCC 13157 TaxID=1353007 RepID=A0A370P9S9_ASPPH|nr:hypothetical protein M752DRAFT_269521 [Aspergillus phoenicis ATCC 13157]